MIGFQVLISLLIFLILVVVISKTVRLALNLNEINSVILSVCVSALATIALNNKSNDIVLVVLPFYAALAIGILLVLLIAFLSKKNGKTKDRCLSIDKKNPRTVAKDKIKYQGNSNRMKK